MTNDESTIRDIQKRCFPYLNSSQILWRQKKLGIKSKGKPKYRPPRPEINKELLEREYIDNDKNIIELCLEYDISLSALRNKFKKFGIEIRKNIYETLVGERFGHLCAIQRLDKVSDNGRAIYLCRCDCNNLLEVASNILTGKLRIRCDECKEESYKGYEGISKNKWSRILRGAIRKKSGGKIINALEFTISIEYVWNLFIQQSKKCALSGIDLVMGYHDIDFNTASLDRIDSSKGYIEGNVQWIHKDIQWIKGDFQEEELLTYINLIYKHRIEGK